MVRRLSNVEKAKELCPHRRIKNAPCSILVNELTPCDGDVLSTWYANDEADILRATIAYSSTAKVIEDITMIAISFRVLEKCGFQYKKTPPPKKIPFFEMYNEHYDICRLSIKRAVDVIDLYRVLIKKHAGQSLFFYPQKTLLEKICIAVEQGRYDRSALDETYHKNQISQLDSRLRKRENMRKQGQSVECAL